MSSLCLVYLARLANCCPRGSTETSAWATGMQASPTEHGVHAQCQLGVLNVKSLPTFGYDPETTNTHQADKKTIENGFTQHIDSNNYKDKNTKMMSKVRGPERAGERGIYVRKTGETRIPKTKQKIKRRKS